MLCCSLAILTEHAMLMRLTCTSAMWGCAGDMLGVGALTLPSVFVRLGWLPASVLLAVCALGTLYSGRLFAAMAQQVSTCCSGICRPHSIM